jgi:hypothetical protein
MMVVLLHSILIEATTDDDKALYPSLMRKFSGKSSNDQAEINPHRSCSPHCLRRTRRYHFRQARLDPLAKPLL